MTIAPPSTPLAREAAGLEQPPASSAATLRALDLFCKAGGATKGLQRAGFHVTGVDIERQPRYCGDAFVQADALNPPFDLTSFDFIWASPPCQAHSPLKAVTKKEYPDLIPQTRAMLQASGRPYTIENVVGARLRDPVRLCGGMFGLRTYRHRDFENSFLVWRPEHPRHTALTSTKKRKRDFEAGMHISITGDVGSWCGPACMGIDWMTGDELSQAIPPAYSEYIGRAAIDYIRHREAA